MAEPLDVLCIYDVKPGREEEFQRLIATHWAVLQKAGLVSSEPAKVLRTIARGGKIGFIEMFQWKDQSSSGLAHNSPEVLEIWQPMEALTEKMDFLSTEPVDSLLT